MKVNKEAIQAIIFNVAETALIFLIGLTLGLEMVNILILMFVFMISRGCFGTTLHFKEWYKCLVWSSLILFSLFTVLKVSLPISIVFTIFGAFIMTGKANVNDLYLWSRKDEPSKYQDILDFIKYNELDDKLLEFEEKIKKRDNREYLIYKYRFKEGRTFAEISKLLDMKGPRIAQHLEKIAFAMRLYCGI
jgi:hypothetical protein